MKDIKNHNLVRATQSSALFFAACVAIVSDDLHKADKLCCENIINPLDFVEHDNDVGGLRAFMLATAKKCVELLEQDTAKKT